jgi:hypothetical protein
MSNIESFLKIQMNTVADENIPIINRRMALDSVHEILLTLKNSDTGLYEKYSDMLANIDTAKIINESNTAENNYEEVNTDEEDNYNYNNYNINNNNCNSNAEDVVCCSQCWKSLAIVNDYKYDIYAEEDEYEDTEEYEDDTEEYVEVESVY